MGQRITTAQPSPVKITCNHCSLSNLCLPLALDDNDVNRLEDIVQQGQTFNRGALVFEQQAPFKSCFVVRSGAVKTSVITENGEEQVTGFFLPGEIVVLDSMSDDIYSCTAKALEYTSVCELPFSQLEHLATHIPTLQHHFFQLMSQEIKNSQQLSLLLSKNSAEERIASLLLSLSSRFKRRRLSPTHFNLPMSRSDIANYLGLAVETVSRVITRFQSQGLIKAQGREIQLLDIEALQAVTREFSKCRPT